MKLNIVDNRFQEDPNLAAHLGGHEGETHVDEGALKFLRDKFNIKTMIDVGCGPGSMYHVAEGLGIDWLGVDGDDTIQRDEDVRRNVIIHDYTNEPNLFTKSTSSNTFDLGWTVEFLEHVDAEYIFNFMKTLRQCKYVICTHAFPGQPGKHHVNCREHPYWVDMFKAFGFELDPETTNQVREKSTMVARYMRQQSLFFRKII